MAVLFAHSYSRLNDWRKCPYSAKHKYILKSVEFQQSAKMKRGDDVHKALENRVRLNTTLPPDMAQYEPIAQSVLKANGRKYCEEQLALDETLQPCGYRDWDNCYVRAKIDVLVVNGDTAWNADYKTGKPSDDEDQLCLSSAMLMNSRPEINRVAASYIWTETKTNTTRMYNRENLDEMWAPFLRDFAEIQKAVVTGYWPSKPSNFNCGYCDVNKARLCEFARVPYKGS